MPEGHDLEIIDAEVEPSQELVPGGAPVSLFRTDDPVEIVTQATAVANALADVLKSKGLTTRIGNKDYVQVEGWTLCGSMLGVFPVVEWTRKLENGWEARVEARTRDGAVVGAAEAECLNTETRWKTAEDYSIRSMAQTRAISKALRAPLGFIVALAGYESTPADEMVHQPAKPFDVETDLLPGAIQGEDAPTRLRASLDGFDPTVDWTQVTADMRGFQYGTVVLKELSPDQYADFWRRLSNAVQWITEKVPAGDFPPVEPNKLIGGLAYGFSGHTVELTFLSPSDAPLSKEQSEAIDAALKKQDDDVEFGT